MRPLVQVRGLEKSFEQRGREVRAVDGIDLDLLAGETYSLVGESGSGKTTLGRCLLRLLEPDAGTIRFAGEELTTLSRAALRGRRAEMQMVFQDPYGSLNPRMRIGRVLEEPLRLHRVVHRDQRSAEVARLLEQVGLGPAAARRYPHQLSGGERQRVGIARALASRPRLVVADEPVSALDVSVQGQVLNLLADLGSELGLTLLLVSHDLAVVERISDRVGVMYRGRLVEEGPVAAVTARPRHPYTAALLSAVPIPDPGRRRDLVALREPDGLSPVPSGCEFHPRCPIARERCVEERPVARPDAHGHLATCHFPGEPLVERTSRKV